MIDPIVPPAWVSDALCAQLGTGAADFFFPEKGDSTHTPKSICAACPVAAECLEYALTTRQDHGVWGGLSVRERQRVSREAA